LAAEDNTEQLNIF